MPASVAPTVWRRNERSVPVRRKWAVDEFSRGGSLRGKGQDNHWSGGEVGESAMRNLGWDLTASSYAWDAGMTINEGVQADLSVGIDGAMMMRMVRSRDPESGVANEFLTSVMDREPGLIAVLYLTRWRIERLFDITKNILEETKSWAVGPVARETRAHRVALTHNPLVLLRGALERGHGIREEKVERKREAQRLQRQTRVRALGRKLAAVQKLLPMAVQLTAQFIRSLRNGILC